MAQGKIRWHRGRSESNNVLIFDPGYDYETSLVHIYTKSESISIADAKEEIRSSEYVPEQYQSGLDELPREAISNLLMRARTGNRPTLSWDVNTGNEG